MTARPVIAFGLCLVLGCMLVEPLVQGGRHVIRERALRSYEQFLIAHPYSASHAHRAGTPAAENPGARFEQEFLMTMNPALGVVPDQGLARANARTRELRRRARVGKSAQTQWTSGWTERGPNNVGGRTRAIMFDPNDGTHKRVFAGGVAGGLWYTDDITNSSEPWHNVDDFWANIAIGTIAYDPLNVDVWYAGTGEGWFNIDAVRGGGIFKSTDGGSSWAVLPSTTGSAFQNVQKIVVTETGAVLAATRGTSGGIMRSDSQGSSWTNVLGTSTTPAANGSRAADLEIAANGDIYAAMGIMNSGQVFRSKDDGLSWTHVFGDTTGTPSNLTQFSIYRIELAAAPSDSNRVYLIAQNDNTFGVDGVWRTSNGGASWQAITKPTDCSPSIGSDITRGQGWYNLILAVSPTDEDNVIVGGINLLRSTNGGSSWTNITRSYGGCSSAIASIHPDQHSVVYRPGSDQAAAIGNDGGIYYTADATALNPTYVNRNNGYNVTQYYSAAQSPDSAANVIAGGTQDNGTPLLNNPGESAAISNLTGGDGAYTHINQQTNQTAYASNQWLTMYYSSNGGLSFSRQIPVSGGSPLFINPSDLDENTDHLFFNYSTTQIGRIEQPPYGGSVTVNFLGPAGGFGSNVTHVRASPHAPSSTATVFVGTYSGRLYRGADLHAGGSPSWSQLTALPPSVPGAISSIDFGASEDTMLVTISNYGKKSVWLTRDGGSNWIDLDTGSNLPDMPIWWGMFHPDSPDKVIIGTETGLWYTDNIDASPVSWSVDPDIPHTRVVNLRYRPSDRQLLAATHGRGAWTATLTEITEVTETRLAATVLLEGAYAAADTMAVPAGFRSSVPLNQPYGGVEFNGTPMDYDGIESVSALPPNTIDWVLVGLRTGTVASTTVSGSTRPAFVLSDGSVVGLDGGVLSFAGVIPATYHVVVRHRNHLPVLSRSAFDFSVGQVTLDFTTDTTQAHSEGGPPMKEVSPGVWAMVGGDATIDGQVTAADFNEWLVATKTVATGYMQEDFNLDAQASASDFNIFLANTKGTYASQVPE